MSGDLPGWNGCVGLMPMATCVASVCLWLPILGCVMCSLHVWMVISEITVKFVYQATTMSGSPWGWWWTACDSSWCSTNVHGRALSLVDVQSVDWWLVWALSTSHMSWVYVSTMCDMHAVFWRVLFIWGVCTVACTAVRRVWGNTVCI